MPDQGPRARTDRANPWSSAGKCAFAAVFLSAGAAHFASTGFFLKIMPPSIPFPREMVLLSGAIEIALGILLLIPRTSRIAAWGLVALLVAVLPANIHAYQHQELFSPFPHSSTLHLLRLPFQGVLILWAHAYTRPRRDRAGS